ncbi:MAG: hypothetical protein M5R40_08425 [Anaerolineae bacterium]|nr:hypothetical protein [Anaerolineae bacterium]
MSKFQRYLLNKVLWFLLAFCIALVLNFFLPRLVPGNPVDVIVGQMSAGGGVSGEAMQRIYATYIEEFGLDQPIGGSVPDLPRQAGAGRPGHVLCPFRHRECKT